MSLPPGSRIGPYEITGPLGAGGMGEVYRARDPKLNRDVAIKVLPEALAQDADRMARFTREAQVLASLNHPNIAVIYAVEESALVMELVPGPTLEERIAAGPIPLEEARDIARQIAEGLEAAHERGIMHRDLKPANVKITPEGVVKLLDFGLAKSQAEAPGVSGTMSPTLSLAMTQAGMIMGTAGYMAPEQAAGKVVDKRADIWSFGVVLYEILGGKRLFEGETVAHTLADVLRAEIDLGKLPPSTPAAIRKLLRRCLERNLKKRLRDIGEARILLEDLPADEATATVTKVAVRRGIPLWGAGILAIAAMVPGFFLWRSTRPVLRPMMRFSVDLGPDAVRGGNVTAAISPDGTRLVFPVRSGNATLLATRLLDQSKVEVLAGTEGGTEPFFSPNGEWIAFFADGSLKKISVHGGAAVVLCPYPAAPRGGAWGEDGYIIANIDNNHLVRLPEAGGKPEPLPDKPEDQGERTWRWPQILPGDKGVLFTASQGAGIGNGYEEANLKVLSLKTRKLTVVQTGGYFGRYLPSGHLVYVHHGTLFAIPFDLDTLKTRGTPVPVLDDVAGAPIQGGGQLDFASKPEGQGAFVYLSGKSAGGSVQMAWMEPGGKTDRILSFNAGVVTPRISPDGKMLALSIGGNIELYDAQRDVRTRLTFDGNLNTGPIWTPDGKHLIFGQEAAGQNSIWWIRSNGAGQPQKLFAASEGVVPRSLSPDGRRLAFSRRDPVTQFDIWTLPLDLTDPDRPKPGEPEQFLREEGEQLSPTFSPDGRWIAYGNVVSGSGQVFVRPFPASPDAGKWQVSTNGGVFAVWSRNGKDLLYVGPDNRIMVAAYTAKGTSFSADRPQQWSPVQINRTGLFWSYDVSPDGKRIVAFPVSAAPEGAEKSSVHVMVLLNFFDELKRRLP